MDSNEQSTTISRRAAAMNAGAGGDADTTITINQTGATPPPPPNFRTRPGSNEPLTVVQPRTTAAPSTTIHWGGVAKGVAIITAVAVVGVVGFFAFSALAGGALTAMGGYAGLLNPIVGGLQTGVPLLHGGLTALGGKVALFFGSLFHVSAIPSITTGVTSAVTNSIGLLGGGAAAAATAVAAAPHVANISLLDHSHTTLADAGGHTSADGITAMLAKKTYVADASTQQHSNLANGGADVPDEYLHNTTSAAKMSHHAGEEHQRRFAARNALARTEQANRSWAERTGTAAKSAKSYAEELKAKTEALTQAMDR